MNVALALFNRRKAVGVRAACDLSGLRTIKATEVMLAPSESRWEDPKTVAICCVPKVPGRAASEGGQLGVGLRVL